MRATLIALAVLVAGSTVSAADREYAVVVYGGTSGGVSAAVQAARMGKTVVLIEPGKHLGGLTSGGLGATDIGNKKAIGGLAREFYRRIKTYYAADAVWTREPRAAYKGGGHDSAEDTAWTFEPHVAEKVYNDLLKEHNVPVVFGQRLDLKAGVRKDGTRITAVVMETGETYRGKVFIDATYEGDLMAKAGVSYHVGREANATYGETLNGVEVKHDRSHQFVRNVDPYLKPGDPTSGLVPGVHAGSPGTDGEGDRRVQAYNFRLCATDVPVNRRPWPKPAGYDEKRYELLLRNFEAGDHRLPWNPLLMPNRKTDANNNFAISTDHIGANYDYPDGDYATREKIWKDHVDYQQGLMWTLANHPRVPEKVRQHFQTWALAKDEFLDTDNWPNQLYVREARRMIGAFVMTEHNCRGVRTAEDPVGLAAYTMDSHNTQRYVTKAGFARNEGDVQVGGFPPYPVAYRSLVPKAAECTNLLVPVCLSASHIAYGSIRMEPVFMVLGQSAATAAVLAIDGKTDVQAVDYPKLRERLIADKQVLDWTGPKRPAGIDPKTLAGVVVDDPAAERTGFEATSSTVGPFVGEGYRHDGGTDRGKQWARFRPDLPKAGKYEVRLAYTPNANRATKVAVKVIHAGEESTITVNQRKAAPINGAWVSLGTFSFEAGKTGYVEVSNAGADGYVVIDAVQWLPAKE
ncbi:FAD-dependent oxidoreductase [Fimbriiglobus ruber]|uniref:FAD dependent oxidoreductase n=1 Tax=Fimbriiglobus ruber TaxID=1908690 RepID=A0A225DDU3_9BACT|nr:FAD-dependent oxidoreductase [Fimbriiglobus ruber]OWK36688.1 FAD dependent oxidoreductase [Fimbriiglobus ruber]